jgi:rhodanese-related sulfurtransferase
MVRTPALSLSPLPAAASFYNEDGELLSLRNNKKGMRHVQTFESTSSRTDSFRHHSLADFAEPDPSVRLTFPDALATGRICATLCVPMHRGRRMRQWLAVFALSISVAAQAGPVEQAQAVAAIKEGKLAIDVRSQSDYDAGTVLNAVRVDYRRLVNQLKQVMTDRNLVLVIFSSSDVRAGKAQDKLMKAGYTSIINGGSYDELHNALYDVTDDPAE